MLWIRKPHIYWRHLFYFNFYIHLIRSPQNDGIALPPCLPWLSFIVSFSSFVVPTYIWLVVMFGVVWRPSKAMTLCIFYFLVTYITAPNMLKCHLWHHPPSLQALPNNPPPQTPSFGWLLLDFKKQQPPSMVSAPPVSLFSKDAYCPKRPHSMSLRELCLSHGHTKTVLLHSRPYKSCTNQISTAVQKLYKPNL